MMADEAGNTYKFGDFRIDTVRRRLLSAENGETVALTPKAFELLLVLVENNGRLISKEELMQTVWGDSFVEEANLTQTISVLRKTLGERRNENRFIVTEPGKGYRFVAKVAQGDNHKEVESPKDYKATNLVSDNQTDSLTETNISFLRHPVFVAALCLVLLGTVLFAAYTFSNRAGSTKPPVNVREIKSIAVLPFKTIGTNDESKYISLGMTEALIIKLSGIRQIIVRQSNSVMQYADASPDPTNIGRQLKVDALLDGSVQKDGDRIRVSLRLVSVSDGAPLWAETFDDKYTNLFDVQDSISEKIANALTLKLSGEERALVKKRYTLNAEAELLYIKGRFFWNKRTIDNLRKSIDYYEQAIAKDPNYALAYTGLADCYQLLTEYGVISPKEAFTKAREAATKALQIDGELAEAHTSLAYTLTFYDWDWVNAEKEFKRAIEINPNYATAHQWYGEFLIAVGRFDEALAEFERAMQIDPTSLIINVDHASYFFTTRQFDKSIALSKKVIEMDPNFAYGYVFLWFSYEQKGMEKEMVDALANAIKYFGEPREAEEIRATYAKRGIKAMWQKRLEQINSSPNIESTSAWARVLVYLRLDDKDTLFEWLNKSYENRDRWIINIKYDPEFDTVRDDPRFQEIVSKLKL